VWISGPLKRRRARRLVFIKGSGDPKLVHERLWLLLRRCSSWACARSAATSCWTTAPWAVPEVPAGDFDGEPLRPYNVRPARCCSTTAR
jgi:D-alanyl-D-alanine carboxypeptidase/D-alanyl-D-alanine-endopeptidase (penicillin-binding protein 4)